MAFDMIESGSINVVSRNRPENTATVTDMIPMNSIQIRAHIYALDINTNILPSACVKW